MKRLLVALLICVFSSLDAAPVAPVVPSGAEPSSHFDVKIATEAWLTSVPADAKKNSDSYFEGGYWLVLWDFLSTVAVMLLLLETGASTKMRDFAERLTSIKFLQSWIYLIELVLAAGILTFPLTVYEGWLRERNYGLSNQTFSAWSSEQLIGLGLTLALGGPAFSMVVAIVRKLQHTWPLWGALACLVFGTIGAIVAPVFIAPLFNKYKPLEDQSSRIRF